MPATTLLRHPSRILAVAGAAAFLITGCGSSGTGASTPVSSDAITIKDFQFNDVTVHAGATVKVTNDDSSAHNVTSDAANAFQTRNIAQGETVTFTAPETPGEYDYICSIHTYMKGTLTVVP